MGNFSDVITADMRLVILRFLMESDGDYRLNSSILHKLLDMKAGYTTPRDKMITELNWLKEQGYIALEDAGSIFIATLTQRGLDVASGSARVPGVARPSPRG
ncbi:MAG: hypothetical protein WA003_08690 [Desulfuromonadaceae bacterium]